MDRCAGLRDDEVSVDRLIMGWATESDCMERGVSYTQVIAPGFILRWLVWFFDESYRRHGK